MEKAEKAFLLISVILLSYFDIILVVNSYYSYEFSYATQIIVKSSIPLIILLAYYFVATYHMGKIAVNTHLFFGSLLSFCLIILCKILYYSLVIDKLYKPALLGLYISALIFLLLAFSDNFQENAKFFKYFSVVVPTVLILQFILSFDYIIGNYYTNPNRYEFVKYHYFSEEEISDFPDKIPDDATNIQFYCEPRGLRDPIRTLNLKYDSPSIQDNDHHASYNIIIH